jgi:Na+/H+ antiporter NhaD/arsenite permease-like protein
MGANVGSVLSITGNPQNMLVGIWSGASFGGFLVRMLPVAFGGLALTYGYLRWAFRADLREPFREVLATVPLSLDRPLVTKGLTVFAVAVVAWLAGGSLPLVAITAGALMVAVAQRDPAYAIDRIEWALLLFFASLFVVMRGLEHTGAVAWIDARAVTLAQGGSAWGGATAVSGVMLTLSNLISNVPAVLLWRNTVPTLPDPDLTWRIVAMSSRATAPTVFPSSSTSRTAPARNSSENCRRSRRPILSDPILAIVSAFRMMPTESDHAQP